MLNELKREANLTATENGAVAFRSTHSACLDLFASCGALRVASEEDIIARFARAFTEDSDIAMRILFYLRDIRGGLGERRSFRYALRFLAQTAPQSIIRNLPLIAEYGRYDDLLWLLQTPCEDEVVQLIRDQLQADLDALHNNKHISLLAKWLPSVNTSSTETRACAKYLCRLLGMRQKAYRRALSSLRASIDILENRLRCGDLPRDYTACPGKAIFKYRQALHRRDPVYFEKYMKDVREGRVAMHTSVVYPYEIVRAAKNCIDLDEQLTLDTMWRALPDYTDGRNALAVIDGSASMTWGLDNNVSPADIALSLGIYFAERNTGHFSNHFITFSETPQLVEIKGNTIGARVRFCDTFNEIANTDLYEVFMLILITAIRHNLPQSELPELLYIISDMEFDCGTVPDKTVFEDAREKYEEYGYTLPQVIYWNVCARNNQYPVTMDEHGCALVSGASPTLFSQMMSHELTPYSMMEQVLSSPRYSSICA